MTSACEGEAEANNLSLELRSKATLSSSCRSSTRQTGLEW